MEVSFLLTGIFMGFLGGYLVASRETDKLRQHDRLMAEQLALMMAQNKRLLDGLETDPADWWRES